MSENVTDHRHHQYLVNKIVILGRLRSHNQLQTSGAIHGQTMYPSQQYIHDRLFCFLCVSSSCSPAKSCVLCNACPQRRINLRKFILVRRLFVTEKVWDVEVDKHHISNHQATTKGQNKGEGMAYKAPQIYRAVNTTIQPKSQVNMPHQTWEKNRLEHKKKDLF